MSKKVSFADVLVQLFAGCITGQDRTTYGAFLAMSAIGRTIFQHTDFDGVLIYAQKRSADATAKLLGMDDSEAGFDKALNDAEDWLVSVKAIETLASQFQDAHTELLGKPYEFTPKVSGQTRGGDRDARIEALRKGQLASTG